MQTFVAQCQEDMDVMNHHINDSSSALGRRVRVSTYFREQDNNSILSPPMSPTEVRASLSFRALCLTRRIDAGDRFRDVRP